MTRHCHNFILPIAVAALLTALVGGAAAQDADNDGIPDDIEAQLGTNPDLDEGLALVIDDRPHGEGDENYRGEHCPDIDRVYFAHVADNRYVWKVTFADEYPDDDTIFHLYTDIDDDKVTGRQDKDWVRGVDIMYSMVDSRPGPRLINPDVRTNPAIPVRMVVRGDSVYVCDDIDANTADGKTHFRMWVLSQVRSNQSDADDTEHIYLQQPLHPERELPELPYAEPENADFIAIRNFNELAYNLWQDDGTLRLKPDDAEVTGFDVLMNGDFVGEGDGEQIASWECPVSGEYRVGLILRDQRGQRGALHIRVDGKKVATFVGYCQGHRQVLHFTEGPVQLQQGATIDVMRAGESAPARFHSVCLLDEEPEVPPLRIENIEAWHMPDEPGERSGRIMIACTTNRPADATIRYSLAGPEAYQQSGTIDEDRGHVNNHFIILPPGLNASGYQLRITCREAESRYHDPRTATAQHTVWTDPLIHARQQGRAAASEGEPVHIPVTVSEPTDRSREDWPVRAGVPLPGGVLADASRCRLVDSSGQPVRAQFEPLAWWPDRTSIRWLSVDSLADTTGAGGATEYELICNVEPGSVHNAISIQSDGSEIGLAPEGPGEPIGAASLPLTIDTGAVVVHLPEGGFAPFTDVRYRGEAVSGGRADQGGFELTGPEGTVYSSALVPPDEIVVEAAGPVRATIRVTGKLAAEDGSSYMRYLCRMHVYAGKPWVHTVFSLDNDVTDPDMNLFESLHVRVPVALANARFTFGADGEVRQLDPGSDVLQDYDNHFRAGGREGERVDGWLLARGDEGSAAVAVRDFRQLYPKGFAADQSGVTIQLLPKLPSDQYADASDDDITKLYYWCDGGKYKIRTGVRLSTEFCVDYAPATDAGGNSYEYGEFWQEPLFAECSPEWYCSSGAFGPMIPRTEGKFDVYEAKLDGAFEDFLERRDSVREYGFMNYGDWFGERTWNWGNIEYDTQWALAVNFARTGNLGMLRRGEEAAWHNADVDVTHYWPNEGTIGRPWTHCVGHTAGYFPRQWKDMGWFNVGPRGAGHTWDQGLFYMYALTGRRRYLQTGRLTADYVARNTTDFRFGTERSAGWPIIGLIGAYNVTGNPFYLNGAKLIADEAMWSVHPDTGGWGHFLDPNECKHRPRCWGCKPFMTGVLLHGLKMYDLVQPRDDIKDTIHTVCDFIWRDAYIPDDNGFYYSGCKSFRDRGSKWTISLIGDGLAYECLLDPERRHLETLMKATSGFMHQAGISSFGKGFTQGTCFMPQMLHDLNELGVMTVPEPPPPGAKDTAWLRPTVYLAPGETARLRPFIYHWGTAPAQCRMKLTMEGSGWFSAAEPTMTWTAEPGSSLGPQIAAAAPADASAGASQQTKAMVQVGEASSELTVTAVAIERGQLGDGIGWVTSEDDPLRLAAEALGLEVPPIDDVAEAGLSSLKTLIVGSEAFNKDFANVREGAGRIHRWTASGGRLIVGQLNDENWDPGLLPVGLSLSDTNDESGGITAPRHPLFLQPNSLSDIAGIVSYDSIALHGPQWHVLAENASGAPAILQAQVGYGDVLVVMPSFDRPVAGAEELSPEQLHTCRAFMQNLFQYAGY